MLVAGPCAIESRKQAYKIARYVKSEGATIFRGGAWKGQNKPFPNGKPAYWGLKESAVDILANIQEDLKMPCVTEVQSEQQADYCVNTGLDYLQVGARHMQNFPLLKVLGEYLHNHKLEKVILKRGLGNTVDEWIGAAEHLGGPKHVILCERGIATFDRTNDTRWRLDLVAIAYIVKYTRYNIIADPSHGSGDRQLVSLLSQACMQITDGLMLEVHDNPDESPTDAKQTIDFKEFRKIAEMYKNVSRTKKIRQ